MKKNRFETSDVRWLVLALAVALSLGFLAGPAMSAEGV